MIIQPIYKRLKTVFFRTDEWTGFFETSHPKTVRTGQIYAINSIMEFIPSTRHQHPQKVKRMSIRLPSSLKDIRYEETLHRLKLTTLKTRRLCDLIQFFKFIKKIDVISWNTNPIWSAPRAEKRIPTKIAQQRAKVPSLAAFYYYYFYNSVGNSYFIFWLIQKIVPFTLEYKTIPLSIKTCLYFIFELTRQIKIIKKDDQAH